MSIRLSNLTLLVPHYIHRYATISKSITSRSHLSHRHSDHTLPPPFISHRHTLRTSTLPPHCHSCRTVQDVAVRGVWTFESLSNGWIYFKVRVLNAVWLFVCVMSGQVSTSQALSFVVVGAFWGCTNPLLKRASEGIDKIQGGWLAVFPNLRPICRACTPRA